MRILLSLILCVSLAPAQQFFFGSSVGTTTASGGSGGGSGIGYTGCDADQSPSPTFAPGGGGKGAPIYVIASTCWTGATICYTTDSSDPAASTPGSCSHGTAYTTSFLLSATTTVRALATKAAGTNTGTSYVVYTFAGGGGPGGGYTGCATSQSPVPTFSPGGGFETGSVTVSMSTCWTGATLCYTTDSSLPTADGLGACTHGTAGSSGASVSVSATTTIYALAAKSGLTTTSIAGENYIYTGH